MTNDEPPSPPLSTTTTSQVKVKTRTKKCASCPKRYPATILYWYPSADSKDGWHSYCRTCKRKKQRKFWMDNYSADGRLRRATLLLPKYYLLLSDRSGGLPVILIYTAGGLIMGRMHDAIDGDELPDKYAGLSRLPDITTSRTNLERQRARGLSAARGRRTKGGGGDDDDGEPAVVNQVEWPDGTTILTYADGQELVTAPDGKMTLLTPSKAPQDRKTGK